MEHKDLASSIISKMFWIIVTLLILLFLTNSMWIYYVNQYEFVTTEITQETNDTDSSTINMNGVDR